MRTHFDRERLIWNSRNNGGEKLILLCLNSFVDANGECFPGVPLIAEMCGVTERTVIRTIKNLMDQGAIVKFKQFDEHNRQKSNRYRVIFDRLEAGVTNCQGEGDKMTPTGVTNCQGEGDNLSPTGVTNCHPIYPYRTDQEIYPKELNKESAVSEASQTQKTEQPFGQIPEWRNDNSPNGLKPDFVAYVRDTYFPTLPEFKDGKSKPDTLRARNWITIRERSRNPDHQVLLNVVAAWQSDQPEPDRQEERDRAWLEEARIMGNRFYETSDGRIDPARWDFYKANKHLIFPGELING